MHFASQGRPLVGDAAYGTGLIFSRLFLHCRRLALRDASGKRVVGKAGALWLTVRLPREAKLPNELQELLGQLRSIQERPGHWRLDLTRWVLGRSLWPYINVTSQRPKSIQNISKRYIYISSIIQNHIDKSAQVLTS